MNTTQSIPPGSTDAPLSAATLLIPRSVRRRSLVGLIGVVVAFVSIGTLFALQQPPFVGADEKAHLGYAHLVADGELPRIDTRQPVPSWATQWLSETIYTDDDENRTVWVANHPPLPYLATAPVVWWSEWTQRPDGGLFPMRIANVVWGAVGVAFTYLIAKELTRSSRLALLSAGAAAMMTQFYAALSLAMTDGMTFAAGAAVTWAGVRCLRRGTTPENLGLLSLCAVVAAGTRAVTLLIAVAVVGIVALFELTDRWAVRDGRAHRAVVRDGLGAATRVGLAGLLPALIVWGWFYVRNIVLYGDIGASSYLLDRFDREPNGSFLATLNDNGLWRALYARSMSPLTYAGPRPPFMIFVAALALGGIAGVLLTRRTGDRADDGASPVVARRSILLLLTVVAVIVVYVAQHVSGGGYLHARYAFPAIGAVATLLVIGLDRIVPRLLPLVVVLGMGTWTLSQIPVGVDPDYHSRPRDGNRLAPAALRTLPGGDLARWFAVSGIVIGITTAVVTLTVVTVQALRRDAPEGVAPERLPADSRRQIRS